MTYFVYLESPIAVESNSEEEAIEAAKNMICENIDSLSFSVEREDIEEDE